MSWEYTSATIHGNKADPQPGDSVDILLTNPVTGDEQTLSWTFSDGDTRPAFQAMVKGEITAMVDHLNTTRPDQDATEEFRPAAKAQSLPRRLTASRVTMCSATTRAGNPCRNKAVWGSQPPLCSSHGGRI